MSTRAAGQLGSRRSSATVLSHRGWSLPLTFQEILTATVRLRHDRQSVSEAGAFRDQVKAALKAAEQEARASGYSAEDTRRVIFAAVAFLDESVLASHRPVFADWPRLPLQTELFGHQNAGEIVFQDIEQVLARNDSPEVADLLEVYTLLLLLGFKGRYAAAGKGDLRSLIDEMRSKIERIRGRTPPLAPRGLLPPEPLPAEPVDPWLERLTTAAVVAAVAAVVIFVVAKILLMAGMSTFFSLTAVTN